LVKVIILSLYKDERLVNLAFDLGVCGYVLKEDAVEEIIACIKTVAQNHNYISPSLHEFFFKRITGKSKLSKLDFLIPIIYATTVFEPGIVAMAPRIHSQPARRLTFSGSATSFFNSASTAAFFASNDP
jgi:hypothetical protein